LVVDSSNLICSFCSIAIRLRPESVTSRYSSFSLYSAAVVSNSRESVAAALAFAFADRTSCSALANSRFDKMENVMIAATKTAMQAMAI